MSRSIKSKNYLQRSYSVVIIPNLSAISFVKMLGL